MGPADAAGGASSACESRSRKPLCLHTRVPGVVVVRDELGRYGDQVMQGPVDHCEDFGGSHGRVLSREGMWPDFGPVGFLYLHGEQRL